MQRQLRFVSTVLGACLLFLGLVTASSAQVAPPADAPLGVPPTGQADVSAQEAQPPPAGQIPPAPPSGYGNQSSVAGTGPGYEQPPPGQPVAASEPPAEDQDVRYMDANVDRVIMYSTAETHPAGTFFFSIYELILLQFGYSLTDQIQIALSGVPPLIEDQPYFFDLSLKANVLRSPVMRMALLGAFDLVIIDGDAFWGGRLNATGTACFNATCQSSLSLNVGTFVNDDTTDFLPINLALGLVGRVSNLVAILVEPLYSFVVGDVVEGIDGFLLNYGVRLSGQNWGVDLTLVRPFIADISGPFILGIPFVSFTYRTDGDRTDVSPPGTQRSAPAGTGPY